MTKIYAALIAVFLLASGVAAQAEQIVWEKDFKKAQQMARESGKPLLLDFTAEWCKPCKAMDAEFWVLEDVVKAVKPFVAVKIDFDRERSLVGRYNVSAIPFVAFTDPLGNMVTFRKGFGTKSVSEINQIFEEMPKDFSNLKKAYDAIELKKSDGLALLEIADSYRASKMLFLSNEFYKRAAKTEEIQTDAEKKERVAVTLGLNAFGYKDYKQAIEYMTDYLKDFPAGKRRETAIAVLTVGNANLGKIKEAEKHLELLKTEFPASQNLAAAAKAVEDAKSKRSK